MNPPVPLSAIRIFEAAARRRSFEAAAGELNRSPSAVSHAIAYVGRHFVCPAFARWLAGERAIDRNPELA